MDASVPLGVHGTGHTVGSVFHLLCRTNYVVTSGGPCGDVCGPETNLGAIVARRTVGQGGGGHLFDTPFPGLLATAKSSTVVDAPATLVCICGRNDRCIDRLFFDRTCHALVVGCSGGEHWNEGHSNEGNDALIVVARTVAEHRPTRRFGRHHVCIVY